MAHHRSWTGITLMTLSSSLMLGLARRTGARESGRMWEAVAVSKIDLHNGNSIIVEDCGHVFGRELVGCV